MGKYRIKETTQGENTWYTPQWYHKYSFWERFFSGWFTDGDWNGYRNYPYSVKTFDTYKEAQKLIQDVNLRSKEIEETKIKYHELNQP